MFSRCRWPLCSTRATIGAPSAIFEHAARVFFVLPYQDRNIWGATAGMLVNLAEVLAG